MQRLVAAARAGRVATALFAFAALAAPLAGSTAAAGPAATPDRPRPPDVVWIMTDDLDMQVFDSALQGGWLPHIQAEIIGKSTRFPESFTALPECCPSRTTYLTGQYPHNHGVLANVGPRGGFEHFDKDGSTLATWLHAAGYRTALVGKYLNGYGFSPKDHHGSYVPPGWDVWNALTSTLQYKYFMSVDGVLRHYGHEEADYQTDVVAKLARDFVAGTKPGQPLFLTLTPTAPHYEGAEENDGEFIRPPQRYLDTPPLKRLPLEKWPSFNEADMSDKPVWMRDAPLVDAVQQRAGYNSRIAAMRAVDDLVGTVVSTLEQTGRISNTLLVFTSDNGYLYGAHRLTRKTELYEESIRVPLYIRAPGQTQARASATWAMNIDWAPTIVDYARARPDIEMDGQSLRPSVEGDDRAQPGRRTLLVEHPNDGRVLDDHPAYDMIRSKDPVLTGDSSGKTVYVYAETYNRKDMLTDRELYDLAADPYQVESLARIPDEEIVAKMEAFAARMAQLKACAGKTCRSLGR